MFLIYFRYLLRAELHSPLLIYCEVKYVKLMFYTEFMSRPYTIWLIIN